MSDIVNLSCFGKGIRACYTTRHGGFSQKPYASFNLGLHVGDNAVAVNKNRDRLKQLLSLDHICYMDQVHGSDVVYVKDDVTLFKADALVTDKKDLGLAVMTADCLPVLLACDSGSCVAAVHCGWRSTLSGIISKTFLRMRDLGCIKATAFMGPCIGAKSFEVGSEVKEAFLQQNQDYAKFFVLNDRGRYMCSLASICKSELKSLGIDNIHMAAIDTYTHTDDFFSYRKESTTGRMASVIAIKSVK